VVLRDVDRWIWDAWYAVDGDRVHAFFLNAPRSLGDPELRHWQARAGHAVSSDLRTWERRPDALGPGQPGAFDDRAIWTGSVLRHGSRWLMFYTGIRAADPRVQRIGLAISDDLESWTRTDTMIEADGRWYEKSAGGSEEHWRDPWAFVGPDGAIHLLVTARAKDGPRQGRGVIGHAWSGDLVTWLVGPPLSTTSGLFQLEVPQRVHVGERWFVLFSARKGDHSPELLARPGAVAESGTHYLVGDAPLGPFRLAPGRFLVGGDRLYAGRIVEFGGEHHLMAWIDQEQGRFVGELGDPVPVHFDGGVIRLGGTRSRAPRAERNARRTG